MHTFLILAYCVNSVFYTVKSICGEGTWATFSPDHLSGHWWLYLPQQKAKHGKAAAGVGGREGRKEGSMERWMERQTWWIHGGPKVSRPCGVVGIAVMLIDAWLFASAFTVNTRKAQERKIQQWEQMRKRAGSVFTMMKSHNRNCWRGQADDIWKRFTDRLKHMQKEEYLHHTVSTQRPCQAIMTRAVHESCVILSEYK